MRHRSAGSPPEVGNGFSLVICTMSCVSVVDVWRPLSAAQKLLQKGHLAEKGLVHSRAAGMRCCGTRYEPFARQYPRLQSTF